VCVYLHACVCAHTHMYMWWGSWHMYIVAHDRTARKGLIIRVYLSKCLGLSSQSDLVTLHTGRKALIRIHLFKSHTQTVWQWSHPHMDGNLSNGGMLTPAGSITTSQGTRGSNKTNQRINIMKYWKGRYFNVWQGKGLRNKHKGMASPDNQINWWNLNWTSKKFYELLN
jgi:hypothetical protein